MEVTRVEQQPKPPCERHCPGRSAGCGVTCERWREYETARNAFYDRRTAERDSEYSLTPANQKARHDLTMARKRRRVTYR